ncbi:MAG: DUF2063 domain-containing protein [Alphaproteobacteria bacterium]
MPEHAAFTDEFAAALLDPERRPHLFEGDAGRVDAGLDVYRNNVMHSLIEALADIYPVVKALVGGEFFAGLAREYIRAEPPASPVLADYGHSFPGFLERYESVHREPYLPDVARIERAWLNAYHAPDARPLKAESLSTIPPEEYASAVFTCHPSLGCVASPWPVCTIWEAHQQDGEMPEIDLRQGGEETLIVRPGMEVQVWRVPPGTNGFLAALKTGRTLAEAMEEVCAGGAEFDLGTAMGILIQAGAFTAFAIQTTGGTTEAGN